jgi:hypothetical protein
VRAARGQGEEKEGNGLESEFEGAETSADGGAGGGEGIADKPVKPGELRAGAHRWGVVSLVAVAPGDGSAEAYCLRIGVGVARPLLQGGAVYVVAGGEGGEVIGGCGVVVEEGVVVDVDGERWAGVRLIA